MTSDNREIGHINSFEFVAHLPPVFSSRPEEALARSAQGAYLKTLEILEASEFYHADQLKLDLYPKSFGFSIRYNDADYGFEFTFVEDRLVLRRQGGSRDAFETWYRRLMPSLGSLVDATLRSMEDESEWDRIEVQRAQFVFSIVAYDMRRNPEGLVVRNSEVVPRLIKAVPGDKGRLTPTNAASMPFGRIDYKVSRWVALPNDCMVREVYDVEAPGNRNYTSVWLTYSVIGETYEAAADGRRKFDFDLFLEGNGEDFFDTLLGKFVNGFVADLFEGFTFETTAGRLP